MVKEAESHAKDDEEKRAKVEARNQLDSLVYQVEKDTGEWGDKVSEGTRSRLNQALEKAKEALKGNDRASINSARDELMQAFSAAGQEMYQSAAAQSQPSSGPEPEPAAEEPAAGEPAAEGPAKAAPDEGVVEADYEIVDDNK
jgi:molecular chaperone DnaK